MATKETRTDKNVNVKKLSFVCKLDSLTKRRNPGKMKWFKKGAIQPIVHKSST